MDGGAPEPDPALGQAGAAQGQAVRELAAALSRGHGPSQALQTAAQACVQRSPAVVYVGLAVMAKDKQSVQYHSLHSAVAGAARLGALATASAAAGLAIEMKQTVHVRDVAAGDMGMRDLQYMLYEHGASSFVALPLVVAQGALAALCLAANQPDAFAGQDEWLQVVAALCAPYLALLRSHQELLALESLITHMMPVQAALQLRNNANQAAAAAAAAVSSITEQLPAVPAASGQPMAGASAAPAAVLAPEPSAAPAPRQQQHPLPPQQQQQPARMCWRPAFEPPQLELAYQTSIMRAWQQRLDGLFLLLTLLSAVGGRLWHGVTGSPVVDGVSCLLAALALVQLLQALAAAPPQRYLAWRQPAVAAVQLLGAALFCHRLAALPARAYERGGSGGGVAALLGWSQAEAASCGLLLLRGLAGQLAPPLHAAVQLLCAAGVLAALWAHAVARAGQQAAAPPHAAALQLLAGWLLPVVAVALLDCRCRAAFARRIR